MTALAVATFAVLVVAVAGLTVFPVWYWLWADWRATEEGRHLMAYSVVIGSVYGATLGLAVAGLFGKGLPPVVGLVIQLVLFSATAAVAWWRVWLLAKAQGRHPIQRFRDRVRRLLPWRRR